MKQIDLNGIEVELRKHRWSKRISLKIQGSKAVITLPTYVPYSAGRLFAQKNHDWIKRHLGAAKPTNWLPPNADYKRDKAKAKKLIMKKLEEWNYYYNLNWNRVAIRDQATRWGSASSQNNLNFSWRLLYLPVELQDYIVVHEICHLKQPNHSVDFWKLVAQTIPDHKKRRRDLKTYSLL